MQTLVASQEYVRNVRKEIENHMFGIKITTKWLKISQEIYFVSLKIN